MAIWQPIPGSSADASSAAGFMVMYRPEDQELFERRFGRVFGQSLPTASLELGQHYPNTFDPDTGLFTQEVGRLYGPDAYPKPLYDYLVDRHEAAVDDHEISWGDVWLTIRPYLIGGVLGAFSGWALGTWVTSLEGVTAAITAEALTWTTASVGLLGDIGIFDIDPDSISFLYGFSYGIGAMTDWLWEKTPGMPSRHDILRVDYNPDWAGELHHNVRNFLTGKDAPAPIIQIYEGPDLIDRAAAWLSSWTSPQPDWDWFMEIYN